MRRRPALRLSHLRTEARRPPRPTPAQAPPPPPIALTPAVACDPDTPADVLWHIARHAPALRRWVVANRNADANLLEFISQQGGPGVREALSLLLDELDRNARH